LQVAKELGDNVQILKLDVDKNPSMSTRLQVILLLSRAWGVFACIEWGPPIAGWSMVYTQRDELGLHA
jgi:hypothetical protein